MLILGLRAWREVPWLAKQKLGPAMKFPGDETSQRLLGVYELGEVRARPDLFEYQIPDALILAPQYHQDIALGCDRNILQRDRTQTRSGTTVGCILELMMLARSRGGTSRASGIATFIEAAKIAAKHPQTDDGLGAFLTSEQHARRLWDELNEVLHLWASYCVLINALRKKAKAADIGPLHSLFMPDTLPMFLGTAQHYLNVFAEMVPKGAVDPVLERAGALVVDIGEALPDHRQIADYLFGDPCAPLTSLSLQRD